MRRTIALAMMACASIGPVELGAQGAPATDSLPRGFPTADTVVQKIYDEGMRHSQAAALAQILTDSIGPRLTGSPANLAAVNWVLQRYAEWGVPARREQFGTWRNWTRGPSRVALVTPRARTLEATQLAWSASTPGGGVTGDVVLFPSVAEVGDSAGFARWLTTIRGKFVLLAFPQPTCRPDSSWKAWASPSSYTAMRTARDSAVAEWDRRWDVAGHHPGALRRRIGAAGAAGILVSLWSRGWGVDKIMAAGMDGAPIFDVSCEDYSLLARLASHHQHPRVHAEAAGTLAAAESPVYNAIAEVRGQELADQYVLLSAHLDSWDAGSGATDNGTGTIVMMEAMRLLAKVYPHPRRTILAGHWSGEEQGTLGSGAFATDHPEVLNGLQALFNQDNGTGNIDSVDAQGFIDAPAAFARWMARMPADITAGITIEEPGLARDEDTDSDPFTCRGAPGFSLNSADYDYTDYTWHTARDTYDKIDFDAVKRNATLVAVLAYEASEDPERLARTRRLPPSDPHTGRTIPVPDCELAPRSWAAAHER